ncbi:MAG TPA: LysR family transcriptional regulator [Ilumatobacter sp.]|nr:LysR family transcriptional regulator [Ilumatobacter sp.]
MLPDISIRQLQYLVAVADEPNWAAAAEAVGVSASALSQGLAELERRVGVELFEPLGRRRVLRASAVPVLEHARRVIGLTRDLADWSGRMRGAQTGRVRLGMIDVAAVVHFPDVVRTFGAERPDVALTVSVAPSGALLDQLRAGHVDLVVCVEPPSAVAGVDTEVLVEEPLVVVGPANAPEWGPWVTFPSGSHTRELILTGLRALGTPLEIAAESHQPDVLVQMVRLGLGSTVLPRHGLPDDVTIGPEVATRRLVLARRAASVSDPAVDELAARLVTNGARHRS